eukprot:c53045_g1_i1.p1 GENE.c53045_g1_i1~~c53045_g1_i1.p1  ORF type:complete len:506 (-),score=131.47 c53045_g1_i1:90-1496(-)
MIVAQAVLIGLFAIFTNYSPNAEASADGTGLGDISENYPFFQDIHVMMFIGFGYLMTFLRKYTFGAVGFTMFIAAFCMQWNILCEGFWTAVASNEWSTIKINLDSLIFGDFGAATILISFGGVIGKISPLQLLVMAMIEMVFYTLNEMIMFRQFEGVDIGGSFVIHTFGAYFGLACSAMLTRPMKRRMSVDTAAKLGSAHSSNSSTASNDTFAMIGTLFLFMFWPSFNSALATGSAKQRAVINTVLSLSGACLATFSMSMFLRPNRRLNMVDIQNATLAGGVAVGASANFVLEPWGALLLGSVAGVLSVFGFAILSPILEEKFGLTDTCGIHNLHGMPGVLGCVANIIASRLATESNYSLTGLITTWPRRVDRTANEQAGFQTLSMLVTLGIALITGSMTGWFISRPIFKSPAMLYNDAAYWNIHIAETAGITYDRSPRNKPVGGAMEMTHVKNPNDLFQKRATAPPL